MPEPVSHGWQERVATKIGFSAAFGLAGGWVYAVLQNGPARRWAIATSSSCAVCVGSFAVLQELTRTLRQNDGPANSFLAGGLAAYALSIIQFKCQQRAFAMALACAGGATLADITFTAIDLPLRFRNTLVNLDLLDALPGKTGEAKIAHVKREYTQEELQAATYQSMAYNRTGTWRDYLPVRQLSEEEWDLYQARKAQRFQEKIDRITKPPSEEKS